MPLDPRFIAAARVRMAAVSRQKAETRIARRELLASRPPVTEKVCARCWLLLPASAFHTNGYQPDGLEPKCRSCRSALHWERKGRLERRREGQAAGRVYEPGGTLDVDDARHGSSAAFNDEGCRCEPCRMWGDHERRRLYTASRRSHANRSRVPGFAAAVAVWGHKRRKWAGAGSATGADVLAVLSGARGRCDYCHRPADAGPEGLDVDHVVPRSRGGVHERGNLAAACAPCRRSKRDTDPWAWLRVHGYATPWSPALMAYVPRPMIEAKGKPVPRP